MGLADDRAHKPAPHVGRIHIGRCGPHTSTRAYTRRFGPVWRHHSDSWLQVSIRQQRSSVSSHHRNHRGVGGSRQRFLLGPCPQTGGAVRTMSSPRPCFAPGGVGRLMLRIMPCALPRDLPRVGLRRTARCATGSPDETALLPSPAPVFRSPCGGGPSRDLYVQNPLLAGNEPPSF